jgi:predicted dehydrogenase
MKYLVIGLGSMGKRRIRCLKALGVTDITGFDVREDRKTEAAVKYGISVIDDYGSFNLNEIDAMIISTPPDRHLQYASDAIAGKIPCFIEAGVILEDVSDMINKINRDYSFIAPSCTMKFHPMIRRIKELVRSGEYGSVTNFTYHCGQYLPDWHPWEDIGDYYVSVRETGGAREIVPFELTWITDIFGFPETVKGFFAASAILDTGIEDTYAFSMRYSGFTGNVIVDVVSRFATRSLILNFEKAQLRWNWEENAIKIYDPIKNDWVVFSGNRGRAEEGYNNNIIEDMYIEEIRSFMDGIRDPALFPNYPENDKKVLQLLEKIEDSDGGFNKKLQ